jgi:hypothetical protein
MDYWHSIAVRGQQVDAVQQWAALEGKSASMSEDLYRRYQSGRNGWRDSLAAVRFLAKLSALLFHAWGRLGSP